MSSPDDLGYAAAFRALYDASRGIPVDVPRLRARLVHLADQHGASARDGERTELGAVMCRDFLTVADRLERGDFPGAVRRFRAVFRHRSGVRISSAFLKQPGDPR